MIGREDTAQPPPEPTPGEPAPSHILKVARVDGKVVSLAVQCESPDQAVLALLFGHLQLRNADLVAGTEIMAGLRASGHQLERADTILRRHADAGLVVVAGKHRQKRYRLTTDGKNKAQEIEQSLANS